MGAMRQIKLAKDCRRRAKGAVMAVSERAAYNMMRDGLAVRNYAFMREFEDKTGLPHVRNENAKN